MTNLLHKAKAMLKSLVLFAVLLLSGCAGSQFLRARPTDPDIASKLRLTVQEWQEIQSQFQKRIGNRDTEDLKALYWGRSKTTDMVEVGCADARLGPRPRYGPVFFFAIRDGHWTLLSEMSQWDRN